MKKISGKTKKQLLRELKRRCPDFEITKYVKSKIDSDFEQLARTGRTTMEVFQTDSSDGVNSIYDFIVSKDGLPVIQDLRNAVRASSGRATPIFVTPNKFWIGIPFLIIVNGQGR